MVGDFSKIEKESLAYHARKPHGKISVTATKPLETRHDLSLAYTPGVGAPSMQIAHDPSLASVYTARSNLIAVITNGTAVLGLGSIGPLAAKPVMEGKGVLFKKFADIDVFDLEVNETDVQKFCDIVISLEPTFGAINLEDIKAPECFEIEKILTEKMKIPVFHDDQHGTAITVAAAAYNALEIIGKKFENIKIVCSGAGAAALACLDMLVLMGAKKENIIVCDIDGVIYQDRESNIDSYKMRYASKTDCRTLQDAIKGADMFLGCSAPSVLQKEDVKYMAKDPLIFALANPVPEIMPEDVWQARSDAICATGRSDYPNQINNVLCFPFIFRGALDVGATSINKEMKVSCVQAIAKIARLEIPQLVTDAYGDMPPFGRDYILPKPFDPRLVSYIALAVAKAAMDTGVATRPIKDFDAYESYLQRLSDRSGAVMKPVMDHAIKSIKRVVYCDGEDSRVLRAVQIVADEKIASPILIGRRSVINTRIQKNGLRLQEGRDFELCDPEYDTRYKEYWSLYCKIMERKGVSPKTAKTIVRTEVSVIGALMLYRNEADAMLCGVTETYPLAKRHVNQIIGIKDNKPFSTVMCIISSDGPIFIADTHGIYDPTASEIADITISAKYLVKRFGLEPRVALVSHSNFGSSDLPSARKMSDAFRILQERGESDQVEGEMHGRLALNEGFRAELFPANTLTGNANLLIAPNMDSAHICVSLLSHVCGGISIGPIVLDAKKSAHVLTTTATVRDIVNMTAVSAVDSHQIEKKNKFRIKE